MANQKPQTFENHVRVVPVFVGVLLVFLVNAIDRIYNLRNGVTFQSVFQIVLAGALIALALSARTFAMTVQDRVIRLEMRLRLAGLLSADLRARIPEFTVGQLVALRFAGDEELPALTRKVLDEKLTDRKAIKRLVKEWQPDYLRA